MVFSFRSVLCVMSFIMFGVVPAYVQAESTQSMLDWSDLKEYDRPMRTQSAFKELQLLRVTSDAVKGYLDIKLLVDENYDILGAAYIGFNGERVDFTPEDLPTGVVIFRKSGREVARLMSQDFKPNGNAHFTLIYLSNGLTGSTAKFPMEIVRDGQNWHLELNQEGGRRSFTSMFFKGRFFFGQTIGIESVEVQ